MRTIPWILCVVWVFAGCVGEVIPPVQDSPDTDYFPLPYGDADLPGEDAATEPDDAGEPADATSVGGDATAVEPDAGVADASEEPSDATVPPDASVGADASVGEDAAAVGEDAAVRADASSPADAAAGADAALAGRDAGAPGADAGAAADAGPTIVNPFYATPKWRLWTQDESPVHYSGYNLNDPALKEGDFAPTAQASRKFPDLTVNALPYRFLALLNFDPGNPPTAAGFWDDAYATRDGAHTVLGNSWSNNYGNSIDLNGQYVRVNFGSCQPADILRLGVNFTSESYSNSGHQLVSTAYSIDYTEKNFSFVNTVRATPAYRSYAETIADRSIDSYDALYSHSFNSVGRSGSELGALFKMMVAGGYLPRTTKDLLKRHGAYGLALVNLFRSTLPYAQADGSPLPLGNEMLQRPAYFSNGWNTSQEFIPRNAVYHQYDEPQHLYRMIQAARAMTAAPPVAILKVLGITVEKGGTKLVDNAATDPRIHSANKTLVRVWGNAGETITLRVDASGSYDLQGLPLSFEWQTVYPEQKNLTVVHEGGTVWRLSATHDATLPKGRLPFALFAKTTAGTSGPAFVNFYWAEAGQYESPPYVEAGTPVSTSEVQKNKRPVFTTSLGRDYVNVVPNATASFDLSCSDPEGFPVRFYRWLGEVGTLAGTRFTFTAPASDPGLVHPVHLVCSDGTGGYGSLLLRIAVTPAEGPLPAPWKSTVYGLPEAAGGVSHVSDVFEIVGNGPDVGSSDHGRIVFQDATGDVELTARVVDFRVDGSTSNSSAKGGVMIREDLDGGARDVFAYVQGNKASTTALGVGGHVRASRDASPGAKGRDATLGTVGNYLKAVRRGNTLAALASTDGVVWEQLWTGQATLGTQAVAGLAVTSADGRRGDAVTYARGKFQVVPAAAVALPVAGLAGTLVTSNTYNYKTKATVTLVKAAAGDTLHYTLDGSEPTESSPTYAAAFDLTTAGVTPIKARSFSGGQGSATLVLNLTITP